MTKSTERDAAPRAVIGLALGVALGCAVTSASGGGMLSFEDLARTRNYAQGAPTHAVPLADGRTVLYLRSGARDRDQRLYAFDRQSHTEREVIAPSALGASDALSVAEKARRERMRISAHGFVTFDVTPDGKRVLVSQAGKLFLVGIADGAVQPLGGEDWVAPQISPDGKLVAALKDGEIYLLGTDGRAPRRLTSGASETLRHGEAEFVAQEEMRRTRGFWWSPDSRSIAYEEADLSGVEMHYIADPLNPAHKPSAFRYPRAGTANAKVRLGVIAITGGRTAWLNWDHAMYPYLTRVSWADAQTLRFSVMNRNITEARILSAARDTGRTHTLWVERDADWLDLPQPGFPWPLKSGGFLWASERGGQWQLERHGADGRLLGAVTPDGFRFHELLDVDEAGGSVVVSGGNDRLSDQIYRVPLVGGAPVALTATRGLHSAEFATDHKVFVHDFNLIDGRMGSELCDDTGKAVAELPSAAEKPPYLPNVSYETVGTRELDAMVIRPHDFDPKKSYPVIDFEYTGPAAKMVHAAPRMYFDQQALADRGYIVAIVDNRGTPGRDRAWFRALNRNFIRVQLEDQIDGLKALAEKVPQMDMSRVGVMGWSQGGYFAAISTMMRPDIFKAGVAGAPPVDWTDYDTYYTERYLKVPSDNVEGYRDSNVLSHVDELKRPLLIVSGLTDDNVYFVNTVKLTTALLRAGKPYEQIVLPGTHMLADPTLKARESERVLDFFARTLGAP